MKKTTALLTALAFLLFTLPMSAGDTTGSATGQGIAEGLAVMSTIIAVAGLVIAVLGLLTTLNVIKKSKTKPKEQLAALLLEAGSSSGLKPGIGVLARLYNLSPRQVEEEIILLAAADDFDLKESLADEEKAAVALERVNQSLETRSRSLELFSSAPLHRLKGYFGKSGDSAETVSFDFNLIYNLLLASE